MLEYRSAWQKMTFQGIIVIIQQTLDHKEGASLIKYKPALLNKAKHQLKEKTKGIKIKIWLERRIKTTHIIGSKL